MNKYQKAYEILLEVWQGDKTEEEGFPDYDDINEALYEIDELVNKETPMKVNKQTNKEKSYLTDVSYVYEDVVLGKCPNCETYLHEENEYGEIIDYCPYCGQRLDWSDTDEQH